MHIEASTNEVAPIIITTVTTVIGLLAYVLFTKAEGKEAGRIMYFVGLLWLVCLLAHLH